MMKSARASRRSAATSFVRIARRSRGPSRLAGRALRDGGKTEAAHHLLHRRVPAGGMERAVVGARDGAGVTGVVPDRLPLEVIELRALLGSDRVALAADLEAEVAVLVVADDEVFRKAVHGLVDGAVDEERGARHGRHLARAIGRREVARIPLEEMAVVPSAPDVAVEVEPGVLQRAVVEEELGPDRADPVAVERGEHRSEPARADRYHVAVEKEEGLAGGDAGARVVGRRVAEIGRHHD